MDIFDRLKAAAITDWKSYVDHDFVRRLAARRHLDDLAARAMTERRFTELAALFGKASRLEADFWQMGLDAAERLAER